MADLAIGNWTDEAAGTTDIFQSIDDGVIPIESDYIRSGTGPTNDTARFDMGNIATPGAGDVLIYVRHRRTP